MKFNVHVGEQTSQSMKRRQYPGEHEQVDTRVLTGAGLSRLHVTEDITK